MAITIYMSLYEIEESSDDDATTVKRNEENIEAKSTNSNNKKNKNFANRFLLSQRKWKPSNWQREKCPTKNDNGKLQWLGCDFNNLN